MSVSRSGAARRTNRALGGLVTLVLAVAAMAAIFGTHDHDGADSMTTTPPSVAPTPALVDQPWFATPPPDTAVDFPVATLSCPALAAHLTLSLCGVADSDATGVDRMMVVAHEGFWDPQAGTETVIEIPLDLTVYVAATSDTGESVARPVLTAVITSPYDETYRELALHKIALADSEVLVLAYSMRDDLSAPARVAIQVLASVDGRPRIVAAVSGDDLRVGILDGKLAVIKDADAIDTGAGVAPTPGLVDVITFVGGATWTASTTTIAATDPLLSPFVPSTPANFYAVARSR